ncbi:hypothetical protein Bca4012_037716 [Brassica carinata]
MATDTGKDKQAPDGSSVDLSVNLTPAGNMSTVTTDAAALAQMKELFASAQKKSDEQDKLVAALAKQVETLTAKAMSKIPRGTTRTRGGRRLNFETPNDQAARTDRASSGKNPSEAAPSDAQPVVEKLPPPPESDEGAGIERTDLYISDQSDDSDQDADIHPRRTRSQSARQNASLEKPMKEEEESWGQNRSKTPARASVSRSRAPACRLLDRYDLFPAKPS